MSDLISRAEAIEAVCRTRCRDKAKGCPAHSCPVIEEFDALPSAEASQDLAEPNKELKGSDLIRREDAIEAITEEASEAWTESDADFNRGMEMAVSVIKALPSAEAVQGWIPFTRRPMTEEEQKDYPNCTFMFDCVLPDDGDEILVSNGRFVWMDVFCNDIDGCYLDDGDDIDEDMAWMPLPEPYKGGESDE